MADPEKKTFETGGIYKVGDLSINELSDKALKKEDEKLDPFSPAVTNLPVIVKDSDGNRIGNVWSPKKGGLSDAIANVEKGTATKIYLNTDDGSFTNYPYSTLKYKDGKIDINVADDVKNSEWYKNLIGSDSFKNLAKAYAADPTGETKLKITEKDENGKDVEKEKTINDLLWEYKKQLENASKDYKGHIDTRTNISRITNGALNLTDEDIDIMGSYNMFSKDSFSDNDVVFLPKSVSRYFESFESYNPDTRAVSARDFYEGFFNLNKELTDSEKEIAKAIGGGALGSDEEATQGLGESEKDYAIDLVRLRTSQEMNDIVERMTFYKDDMTEEERAGYATEYAKCFSFYKSMTQDTPNSDSWTGFNMSVQATGMGIAHGIVGGAERLAHFFSQIAYAAVDGGVRTAAAINAPFAWLGELFGNFFTGGWDKMTQNTRNMYEHFDEWYMQNSNEGSVLGEMRESIEDLGKALDNQEDLASQVFLGAEADLARTYANTEAMLRIGQIVGYGLTQILATNPIGEAVQGITGYAFANAASVVTNGYSLNALTNMARYFSTMAETSAEVTTANMYLGMLNKMCSVGNVFGWTANMLAQGVVDTFLENPSMTDAMLFGSENVDIEEFQRLIRNNINWNIIGEFAPGFLRGTAGRSGKAIKAFAKTKPGAITQAVLRKGVNWLTIKGRKLYEGISEFMTRKSKEFLVEEGADAFSGKLNPEKRWQNIRKEIIRVQEQIKDTNIFRGEGSWTEQAKKIDDLIQKRVDLEEILGTSKRLAIARGKEKIANNAGLKIENAELGQYTAELTVLSKKMKQTNVPGTFSHQTGDYINDLFNKQLLTNKESFLKSQGKNLSKVEQEGLDILTKRISDYEESLLPEFVDSYKTAVSNFMDSNFRYYKKLNDYLASDAGGNLIPKEKLEGMRANSQYGPAGEMYMPLYALGGFKGSDELEQFLKDPLRIIREGQTKSQVEDLARKRFSSDVAYLDPNFSRDIYTSAYAQVANAADMGDAMEKVGRTTSVPTDSQGNILKTPDAVSKAKNALYKDLEDTFEKTFRENKQFLGPKTVEDTKVKAKDYYKGVKSRAQRTVNDVLGLDDKGLKSYAKTMNAAEIEQINKVYTLPRYSSAVDGIDDLKVMYDSLSASQKKIVDKTVPGFSKNPAISGVQKKYKVENQYSNAADAEILSSRESLESLKKDYDEFLKRGEEYKNSLMWKNKKVSEWTDSAWEGTQKKNIQKFVEGRIESGKKAADKIGFKGKESNFDKWFEKKKAAYDTKISDLENKVKELRGTERPSVSFDGGLYPADSYPTKYIKSYDKRIGIGEDFLGNRNIGDTLENRWLVNAEPEAKADIRAAIESNPDLRNANLSTMYDNSGSKLPFDEWLDTPITLRRQQVVDSLRDEDSFMSFSMNKDWEGIGGVTPRMETQPGDIVTIQIRPRDTLGQIPVGEDYEGELEVLVPREAYASAMNQADELISAGKDAVSRWNTAITDNNLDVLLSRQYIVENKGIIKSKFYKDMVGEARAAELEADEALALRTAKAEVEQAEQGIKTGNLKGTEAAKLNAKKTRDFNKVVKGSITEAVDKTVASLLDNPYLEQLIKEYEKIGVSSDLAKEYIIYQWLFDNSDKGGVLQDIAFRFYNAPSKVSELKISTDAAKNYSKKFQPAARSIIESRLNKLIAKMQEEGTSEIINLEATSKRVEEYFKDITDAWGKKQIVEVWDKEKGQFKYYKVDRSTYTLVTNYPTFKRNNLFARTMARINAIARVGQITIRAASLVTQGFKDTFNATVLGGMDEIILDNPDGYKKIAQYIGPDVIEAFRKEMTPEAWKQFLADAEWQGLTVEEAIAKAETNKELLRARISGGPGTSTSYYSYRNLYENIDESTAGAMEQLKVAADTWTEETKSKWKIAQDKAKSVWYTASQRGRSFTFKAEDVLNTLHNAREVFLREQVYRRNFAEALDAGKSLAQARNYAQYFMENATTNFSRGFAWGSNIIRSIPYFGAMLNGASSMVRLLEVDPLGIMTRFVTDMIIPVIGLTAMSLEDPRNAEIYKNIPEYEKEGNIHWIVDGQVYTIPLPEELAKFVLPIRHAVEKMQSANSNAWHELLMNDLLNMPVIPLNSVMMLDDKKINADPSVMDRISSVGMSLFNSMAPNAARTMYIARTGKDPYTGEDYGRQKWYLDDNGEYQLMSVSEYGFANDMAELFKGWGWNVNPVMAEALFSSFFGTGSLDLAEGIRDLSVSIQEGQPDLSKLVAPSMERAGNVLTGTTRTDKQQAQVAWYSLYYDIKEKKKELLASDGKLAKYAQDIDMAKTQDVLEQRTEKYNAEVRNWQNSVLDKVKKYNEQYGDYFDKSKFAASISMMTAQLSIDNVRNSDNYYNSRALAIETMLDAGFDSPSDGSIFGYITRDKVTGKISIKYTDPLIVSLTEDLFWYQGDEAVQALTDTIYMSGLKDKYNNEIYPEYSEYMNKKDYASANKLAVQWDVELMKTIKPIIDQYTVGNLLSKSTAIDLLDNYILVPSTTEAMGKGKYYSSSTGLNKRRGYAQSYVKKIYEALNKKENK